MDLDLGGKTAIVTGSTRGIGLATAIGLAGMGAEVVVNGRSDAAVQDAIGKLRQAVPSARAQAAPFDLAGAEGCAALTRAWQLFLQDYPVLVMPVSGELPFEDQLDLKDDASFARVWRAQMPQVGLPFMGLPGLTVTTGLSRSPSVAR